MAGSGDGIPRSPSTSAAGPSTTTTLTYMAPAPPRQPTTRQTTPEEPDPASSTIPTVARTPPPLPPRPRPLHIFIRAFPIRVYLKIQSLVLSPPFPPSSHRPVATELIPGDFTLPPLLHTSRFLRHSFAPKYFSSRAFIGSYHDTKAFFEALIPEHRALLRHVYVFVRPGHLPGGLKLEARKKCTTLKAEAKSKGKGKGKGKGKKSRRRGEQEGEDGEEAESTSLQKFAFPLPYKHAPKARLSPGVLSLGGRTQIGFDKELWKNAEKERGRAKEHLEELVNGAHGKGRCVVRVFEGEEDMCAYVVQGGMVGWE
ncbi:hypothetical protein CERZMDRAFT_102456 [Cercospora zeae-maydis SCOH1-5]|uniref:Uncharacterized protein n=1 Tax=Cercospora zeae-maydis SCOH1-5 TaxID=717836 RepID=A0A6A6F0S8_9PEZI|nr:hypothetical protein CERZMDRAFT_102456 [Cercospora zeae-maydis SCOH1-5]